MSVSLSFEALKPDTDFSLEMKHPDGITDSMGMGLGGLRELAVDREAWRPVIHGVTESDVTE